MSGAIRTPFVPLPAAALVLMETATKTYVVRVVTTTAGLGNYMIVHNRRCPKGAAPVSCAADDLDVEVGDELVPCPVGGEYKLVEGESEGEAGAVGPRRPA